MQKLAKATALGWACALSGPRYAYRVERTKSPKRDPNAAPWTMFHGSRVTNPRK